LLFELGESLLKVSATASLIDSEDQFEEKKEDEKQTLTTSIQSLNCLSYLVISKD